MPNDNGHQHRYVVSSTTSRTTRYERVGGQRIRITVCTDHFVSACACGDVSRTWDGAEYSC